MLARRQLSVLAAALTAWLLIDIEEARAQSAAPDVPAAAEPASEASQAQPTSVEPETATQEQVAAQPAQTESDAALASRRARKTQLQAALVKVEQARASKSLLLPWSALSISVAIVATGVVLGLSHGLGCERSCTTSTWPGWLVLAGTTTGTASFVWLELEERSVAELQSRRLGLTRELERIRWDETPARAPHAALAWHGRF